MANMVDRICACGCGVKFRARSSDVKRGWGKFASKSCKAKEQEARTGQYKRFLSSQEHGGEFVAYNHQGDMFRSDGSGVNKYGDPIFIGVSDFDNTSCQNSGD